MQKVFVYAIKNGSVYNYVRVSEAISAEQTNMSSVISNVAKTKTAGTTTLKYTGNR